MAIKTKLVSGQRRIITKVVSGQQRVSCECCEEAECCMYPALGVTDGLITIEDLPDTVIYRGLISGDKTFTKLDPPEEYGSYTAYYITGSFPVGVDGNFIAIDSDGALDQWTNYVQGGINGIGFCLIESFDNITGVNDTFEDTYTVELNYSNIGNIEGSVDETVTVARQSLCVWSGLDSRGNTITIEYISIDGSVEGNPVRLARWLVTFYTYQGDVSEEWSLDKTGSKSSPAGIYGDPPAREGSTGGATVT